MLSAVISPAAEPRIREVTQERTGRGSRPRAWNREHNVVGEGFSSDVMRTGTFSHTFDQTGTFRYSCTLHGNMDGIVEVTG